MKELYVYLGIVGWLFVTGVGIVPFVPEEVAVSGVGIMVSQQGLSLLFCWLSCIVGIIGTDIFLYGVGVTGGKWLLSRSWVKKVISDERREKIIDGFHTHGIKFLVSGRLLPGVRTAIFIVAGAIHYPFLRFLVADLVSIPVISLFFFGSVWAAEWISWLIDNLHNAQNIVLLVLIAGVAAFGAWRYVCFIRRRTKANDFAAPHIPVIEQVLTHLPTGEPKAATDSKAQHAPLPSGTAPATATTSSQS